MAGPGDVKGSRGPARRFTAPTTGILRCTATGCWQAHPPFFPDPHSRRRGSGRSRRPSDARENQGRGRILARRITSHRSVRGWRWLLKLAQSERLGRSGCESLAKNRPRRGNRRLPSGFLSKQTYPIRTGVHPNTAFGLAFAHDAQLRAGHTMSSPLVTERARLIAADVLVPAAGAGAEDASLIGYCRPMAARPPEFRLLNDAPGQVASLVSRRPCSSPHQTDRATSLSISTVST